MIPTDDQDGALFGLLGLVGGWALVVLWVVVGYWLVFGGFCGGGC